MPMKYDDRRNVNGYYNGTLLDSLNEYAEKVGYFFNYEETRNSGYSYKTEDIVGKISKCFLNDDKEIMMYGEIVNNNYEEITSLNCRFFYVWPYMDTIKHRNNNIQVKKVNSIEIIY